MIKRIGEKVIFQKRFFTFKDIELLCEGNKKVTYQILEKPDIAIIVPINNQGELILINEYFTAIDEYQLDLPGGKIDDGYSAIATANKELQEEIGFKAGKIDLLGVLTISPGYIKQQTHIFLARDLTESKLQGDEEEKLEIVKYPFDKFEELIDQGKITEARAIAGLYLARRFLENLKHEQKNDMPE